MRLVEFRVVEERFGLLPRQLCHLLWAKANVKAHLVVIIQPTIIVPSGIPRHPAHLHIEAPLRLRAWNLNEHSLMRVPLDRQYVLELRPRRLQLSAARHYYEVMEEAH